MNELQSKYGGENSAGCKLQIFGFPCNQFGYQEPAENFELRNCIKYVRPGYGFEPLFPLAAKGDVNGFNEHEVFTFLKERCPAPMGLIANRSDITWSPIRNNDISWNFQKWLIQSDGQPFKRYTSRTKPQAIEEDIVSLLKECSKNNNNTTTTNNSNPNNTQTVTNSNNPNNTQTTINNTPVATNNNNANNYAAHYVNYNSLNNVNTNKQGRKKKRSILDYLW